MSEEIPESFEGWAILELMGHRRLGGYVSERTIAGHGMLQIQIFKGPAAPLFDKKQEPDLTQFYSPTSVYCLTPCTEATARAATDGRYMAVHPLDMLEDRREPVPFDPEDDPDPL